MSNLHTLNSLTEDLRNLDLRQGDGVFVHASMRAIGAVSDGPKTVIDALFSAVGEDGLIGMPGFSDDAYPPANLDRTSASATEIAEAEHAVAGFRVDQSPTADMGVIAETFRTWPGTMRSTHPTASICLNGPDADDYVTPHAIGRATGPSSPFGRLRQRPGMKILLIGVGWNRCTPLHTAESYADHMRLKTRRFKSGPGDALWFETPDVANDMDRLFPRVGRAYEETGQVTRGRIGDADARLCGYDALVEYAAAWIGAENKRSGARH